MCISKSWFSDVKMKLFCRYFIFVVNINPFSTGILCKLAFFKKTRNPTLNVNISKTRSISKSTLKLKKQRYFLLPTHPAWLHGRGSAYCTSLHRCQQLAALKRFMMSQKKIQCAHFCLFLLEMNQNFQQTEIFHCWAKAIPLLNPFSPGIIWKIDFF